MRVWHMCRYSPYFRRHGNHKSSDRDAISLWWVLLHGEFKWICHHLPVELCVRISWVLWTSADRRVCLCMWCSCVCVHEICLSPSVYMPASACAVSGRACVLLFQWWQTAEVLFLEELDNLSSEILPQLSLCNQHRMGSSPSPCVIMIQW